MIDDASMHHVVVFRVPYHTERTVPHRIRSNIEEVLN